MKTTREDLYQQVDLILEIEAEQAGAVSSHEDARPQRLFASAALYGVCASLLELDRRHYGSQPPSSPDVVDAVRACLVDSQLRLSTNLLVESAFGAKSGVSGSPERMRRLEGVLNALTHLRDLQEAESE
jgi:hypothetical protein